MRNGIKPSSKTITLDGWKEIINAFPIKIKEVFISGGEPTLISWLPDLCNWLLDKGYHVTVFTNLHIPIFLIRVKRSRRFQIYATFHQEQDDMDSFTGAYNEL
jgi:organic radical activating enzyme